MLAAIVAGVSIGGHNMEVDLNSLAKFSVEAAREEFADDKLGDEDVSLTIHDLDRKNKRVVKGDYLGDVVMYPASVVKAFYLAYAAHLLDTGKLKMTDELQRASEDMIRASSNDATGYIVDLVCGTTPGPELGKEELKAFGEKRRAVNRWFESKGYTGVNAVQRTYNEGPYGREMQWVGEKYDNRNMLSSNASARLMTDIAFGAHWSEERTEWMQGLLARKNPAEFGEEADGQARVYTGKVIPEGVKLYSKAGWTSSVRHDLAWLVMPDGKEYVFSIQTKRGGNTKMVSFIAAKVLEGLGYNTRDWRVEIVL